MRVELDGIVLAESAAPVMVFETGLPTRYYFDRTAVDFDAPRAHRHRDGLPVQGRHQRRTGRCGSARVHPDLAWAYDFPTRQLQPIAGLVAFYNEKVDVSIDGEPLARPVTHFSRSGA